MRTPKTTRLFSAAIATALVFALCCIYTMAQTPSPAPEPQKQKIQAPVSRVIVENSPPAPQVVTILHRLNGVKFISFLIRSGVPVAGISDLDQTFINLTGKVHTSVIAGLALDDGHTIAAWLPEAEAELPPLPIRFAPRTPQAPRATATAPPTPGETEPAPGRAPFALPSIPTVSFPANFLEPADLRIITRDGKRVTGHYVGLDGLTGLSLITLNRGDLPELSNEKEEAITVGQRLRVISPQPAPRVEPGVKSTIYVRIGETEATVMNISRSPSGSLARVKIRSPQLSAANIGGIAISDAGETLGIVDSVRSGEATIVPLALVRMAAKRVLARQASVPRPWLGIRGEPVGTLPLDRILGVGWELERARALAEMRQGILLTSVVPGSPAALAKLKPGDVILSVNNGSIHNANDLSWLLDEAGPEMPVRFTVARPGVADYEALEIKLSETPDPRIHAFASQMATVYKLRAAAVEGIETVPLKPRLARRYGASGGLLVISVQPVTDAFKAGLRPGDIIESIDGVPVASETEIVTPKAGNTKSTCVVVRQKEKLVLRFQYSKNASATEP
jgi:S1-C subfamily serine protease